MVEGRECSGRSWVKVRFVIVIRKSFLLPYLKQAHVLGALGVHVDYVSFDR